MYKGQEVSRISYCLKYSNYKYHVYDSKGRGCLCNCLGAFMLGNRIKYGLSMRGSRYHKRSKKYGDR